MERQPLRDILSRPAREAFEGFMLRWHGVVPEQREAPPGGERLPASLRRLYEAFGTAPEAFVLGHLLAPDTVGEDDGFTVFYEEEQGVYLWGVRNDDLDADDPPVWCRQNDPGEPWVPESPTVSVFILQMAVMSAALDGPHSAGAAWLRPRETDRVLAPLARLDLPPWHRPTRWYAGEDAVAFTCLNTEADDPDAYLSVWVSALTEDGVRFLEPHLSDAWDYYSPRDG